jgi:hypothetical protein
LFASYLTLQVVDGKQNEIAKDLGGSGNGLDIVLSQHFPAWIEEKTQTTIQEIAGDLDETENGQLLNISYRCYRYIGLIDSTFFSGLFIAKLSNYYDFHFFVT